MLGQRSWPPPLMPSLRPSSARNYAAGRLSQVDNKFQTYSKPAAVQCRPGAACCLQPCPPATAAVAVAITSQGAVRHQARSQLDLGVAEVHFRVLRHELRAVADGSMRGGWPSV